MPKQIAKQEVNSFVGGFITEASPLNFPPNASTDEENFNLFTDGTRGRRKGLDWEAEKDLIDSGITVSALRDSAYNTFKWTSPGGDSSKEILVVQVAKKLFFFLLNESRLSSEGYLGSLTLPISASNVRFSFAAVEGILTVAAGEEDIYTVQYNGSSFSQKSYRLLVRDMWGVYINESQNKTFRPKQPSEFHIYNLRNQGWALPRRSPKFSIGTYEIVTKTGPETGEVLPSGIDYGKKLINIVATPDTSGSEATKFDPIACVYAHRGYFPSLVDSLWAGMSMSTVSPVPYETFYPVQMESAQGDSGVYAKGFFVIDALRRGTSRLSALNLHRKRYTSIKFNPTYLPADYTTGGASVVESFAGRVFYAGFNGAVVNGDANSPDLTNMILFSQLVKGGDDVNKCYQEGDPTSRESSDVVDTDGGFIKISGAGNIIRMVNVGKSLAVIATNGVWIVQGGSDYGFTATNYLVEKISSSGCQSPFSVVAVEGAVFYWADAGIIRIAKNEFGDYVASNLSEKTIQTFYDDIPLEYKQNVIGFYDEFQKKILWLYGQQEDINQEYVTELRFDLKLGAFSKYKLNNYNTNIVSLVPTASFKTSLKEDTVIVNGVDVEVNAVDVEVYSTQKTSEIPTTKYLVMSGTTTLYFSFAELSNTEFKDWGVIDAKAFMITGQIVGGDSAMIKQSPYLTMHFFRTEEGVDEDFVPLKQSSCKVRSMWDWSNTINSKKWGPLFQAYRYKRPVFTIDAEDLYDNGFETIVTKNKLRGRGKALSLYMETESGKDCKIIGWNLQFSGNQL